MAHVLKPVAIPFRDPHETVKPDMQQYLMRTFDHAVSPGGNIEIQGMKNQGNLQKTLATGRVKLAQEKIKALSNQLQTNERQ